MIIIISISMLLYVLSMQSCMHPYIFIYVSSHVFRNTGMYFFLLCLHEPFMHPLFLLAESLTASPDSVKYASAHLHCLIRDFADHIWHTVDLFK